MIIVLVGGVVLAPVVVMADLRRWRPLPVLLWLLGTALVVAWVRALEGEGQGVLAGIGWLLAAAAAAGLSVAAARRGVPRRRPRHGR
ncbi:hypothetical protein GCM10027451_23670 [Geodermatophilus aquaeductus]|jgi:hypothetical protein|uniref:Uncharacterized protein n=1 Tax=Geodermatophilus aquaeductus TaxID=1564161 RepID=A0A521AEN5_9ACTN|nr:hypothetical protein [Geodermatophilus aquaeductus]SMO33285.1 hypothetical protein SAMN06273567_10166 [Geodermatophilus aquaeductus]